MRRSPSHDEPEEARGLTWHVRNPSQPVLTLLIALLIVLVMVVGPHFAPQAPIRPAAETTPSVQAVPPTRITLPTAVLHLTWTRTPVPTLAPTALSEGVRVLAANVQNASFELRPDPARSETALYLTAGTFIRFEGERQRDRCRVQLFDGSDAPLVWLDCVALGEQP